jgi:hypothetical protein
VRGGLEGRKVSPGAGVRVMRLARPHAAAVLCLAALLGSGAAWAQGPAPQQPPAAAVQPADNPPADNKPADDSAAKPGEAQGGGGTEANIKLPGVNVQGQRNVFDDNDKKLKALQDSLPCNGCDAKPHTHKKLYKKVLDAVGDRVLPTEAPDHSTHDANDKSLDFANEGNCVGANIKQCTPSNAAP